MEIDLKEIYYVSLSFEFLHLKNEQPKFKKKNPIAIPSSTETDRVPRKKIPMHIRPWLSFLMYIIHLLLLNSNLYGKFIN